MVVDLIYNATLLIALSALYGLWSRFRTDGALRDKVFVGLLFGGIAVIAMTIPFHYGPGIRQPHGWPRDSYGQVEKRHPDLADAITEGRPGTDGRRPPGAVEGRVSSLDLEHLFIADAGLLSLPFGFAVRKNNTALISLLASNLKIPQGY